MIWTRAEKNSYYFQKEKIVIQKKQSGLAVDVETSPCSYVQIPPGGIVTISDGKVAGDILILEGPTFSNSSLKDSDANLELSKDIHTLWEDDTLMLIWDGSKWVEIAYSDN